MTLRILIVIGGGLAASSASAQLHATDVLFKVENGRIITGRDENGTPVYPRYVFSSELGAGGIPNATTEPGFDSEQGTFPAQTLVGVSVRRALREWSGQHFETIPDERLQLTKGLVSIQTPPADPALCQLAGDLPLGLANGFGVLHQHGAYELLQPADPGVYLLELEAWMGQPGGSASDPFWILFSKDQTPAVVDAAALYVETVLACRADFNRDGALTIADFGAFQAAFVGAQPRADMNNDCALTIGDFSAFQAAFVGGCQ